MADEQAQTEEAKRTILIVDADRQTTEAIAVILDQRGLQSIVAHDGQRALALARALEPDLIFLAVDTPGRSGIEVCAALKTDRTTASIPIVFITGRSDQTDRALGIAAGADEYLTKPFSPTELIALVDKVLAGGPIDPRMHQPHPSDLPSDQLVVFAREWRELFERERAERQALEEIHQRLEELDGLKATFLGALTHELVTPFRSIGTKLQALREQPESLPSDYTAALDDLMVGIADLHRLVGGVVKFAELVNKQREPQPGYISLNQVIPWAVQPVAVMAQEQEVDIRVFVPADLPRIHADPELLGEAVFQMAHNAVKFNRPGGQAHVRASEAEDAITIEVADTGVGLTPERLAALGQPFEQDADTLQRGREGLGIGWAFVRYVAEVHSGWTRVESPGPDQGSTFSLILPRSGE